MMSGLKHVSTDAEAMRRRFAEIVKMAPATAEPAVSCPKCNDSRWIRFVDAAGAERVSPCPECCRRKSAVGVPACWQSTTLDDVRPLQGNRLAFQFARAFKESARDLALTGSVGTGKSMIAAALVNEFQLASGGGLFVRVPLALHRLHPGVLGDDERRAFELRLMREPLLVLDDIGAERDIATSFSRTALLMIYEERGDRSVRTILTSNLNLEALTAQQGDDRLASRIAGRADVVRVDGPDQRLRRGDR